MTEDFTTAGEGRDADAEEAGEKLPSPAAGGGGGGPPAPAVPAVSAAVAALNGLQRRRKFLIRVQQKITLASGAFLRGELGWTPALPERERKALNAQALKILRRLDKGEAVADLDPDAAVMMGLSLAQRGPFDDERERIEKEMRRLARDLPVYPWVAAVKGFSDLGLAVVVAEAGDLADYPTHSHLWKRLGVAPKAAYWDAACGAHLVPRQRRAEAWVFCSQGLLKWQWSREKADPETGEVIPAHAIGPYGEVYARKKADYAAREGWTPSHADNAARRYMEKRLLRDLWQAWRRATLALPERATARVPSAENEEPRS